MGDGDVRMRIEWRRRTPVNLFFICLFDTLLFNPGKKKKKKKKKHGEGEGEGE